MTRARVIADARKTSKNEREAEKCRVVSKEGSRNDAATSGLMDSVAVRASGRPLFLNLKGLNHHRLYVRTFGFLAAFTFTAVDPAGSR